MPARAERRRGPLAAAVLLLAATLAACGSSDSTDAPASGQEAGGPSSTPSRGDRSTEPDAEPGTEPGAETDGVAVPPDLARVFGRLLDRRARALLDHDREAFLDTVGTGPSFRAEQEAYYGNLRGLPLAALTYSLDRSTLRRTDDGYWVTVRLGLQLDGFDAAPAQSVDRFRFSPGPRGRGYRLSSVTDAAWEEANGVHGQPWDLEPVEVTRGNGVLVVTDAPLHRRAKALVRSVERGSSDVAARVPYTDWDRSVVVYALADPRFLASLPDLPGRDPGTLDGVAFTIPTSGTDATPVATRVAFSPTVLASAPAARDRLVRHELTHVAVGTHDDRAPVWLAEGLAEWVSVQALAPGDREVEPAALAFARDGVREMPDDRAFNDAEATEHYALAWWVCEYLAGTYGPTAPWLLLDALQEPGVDADAEVERLLQMSTDQLAHRGAKLLKQTFAPPRPGPVDPTDTSADPSSGPSSGPSSDSSTR